MPNACVNGGIEQYEGVGDVVPKILARVGDGFSNVGVSGEVHDGIDAREDTVEFGLIADVPLDEFKTLGEEAEAGGEIVVDDDVVASPPQRTGGVTADVACASYYQNGQKKTSLRKCAPDCEHQCKAPRAEQFSLA